MPNQEDYILDLNPQQQAAVKYIDGPSLVIAGAGSGKTRVLTYKIVHLLNNGFEPYRILALTFTNKAAREMKERIAAAIGQKSASQIWMGTFHSIFLRILRRHADRIGFKPDFTIYDTSDSRSLIKSIVKNLDLDLKLYQPGTIAAIISNEKNSLTSPEQYIADTDNYKTDQRKGRPLTGRIFKIYCDRCRNASAMDFDDILFFTNLLLRDNADIRHHYQDFFRYILVDEYQDTNFAQHLIVSQLSAANQHICVVGDDAQSIYSFRGANIGNILSLGKRYDRLKIFKLERNYRSTRNIVDAANSLIHKNSGQLEKRVYSENAKGEPIKVVSAYSDIDEAYIIAGTISRSKMTCHDSYDQYAVLYRTNAQSRLLEESLRKRGIPYCIYGGLSFYQRKEVKDAICYFRITANPDDDEALRRIINYPARGIGETTVNKIVASATEHNVSLWQVISFPEKYGLIANKGTLKKLADFKALIDEFIADTDNGANAYETAQLIFNRTGIISSLSGEKTPELISKKENLEALLGGVKEFVDNKMNSEEEEENATITGYLSEISLATDTDNDDDSPEPKVTLMTVHAAKGLEFKHIIIAGLEEELFPSALSMDSNEQLEEERRLFYVAITRAKDTCMITFAGSRYRNGETKIMRPSRFLHEIDPNYVQFSTSITFKDTDISHPVSFDNPKPYPIHGMDSPVSSPSRHLSEHPATKQNLRKLTPASFSVASPDLKKGTVINHSKYGNGTVLGFDEERNDIIIVDFIDHGMKKLILKFAKFTIIS